MYVVNPRTILRNIPYVKTGFIMKPGSFLLTKEAVLLCLKGATVYRKFSVDHAERVTILNVDRLHNEKFITEEEWNNRDNIKEKEVSKDIDNRKEESKEDNSIIIDTPVEDSISTDINTDQLAEETLTTADESVLEEAPVEDTISEETEVKEAVETDNIIADESTDNAIEESSMIEVSETIVNDPVENEEASEEIKVEPNKKININYNGKKKHNNNNK